MKVMMWLLGLWLSMVPVLAHAKAPVSLSPGDEVLILIPDAGDLKEHRVTLDLEGYVTLGIHGRIKLGGLSQEGAIAALKAKTAALLSSTAGLHVMRIQRHMLVLVTGHVEKPGIKRLRPGARAWDALQASGGPKRGAELSRAFVVRGEERVTLDLHLAATGARAKAPVLRSGDTLFVPASRTLSRTYGEGGAWLTDRSVEGKVLVLGAVREPGLYERSASMTPWLALGAAKGPTKTANLGSVRVITPTEVRDLDVTRPGASLPKTKAGLIVYVPDASERAFGSWAKVLGHVKTPGFVVVRPGTNLVDALAEAGGMTPKAARDRVTLVRRGDGFSLAMTYDVGSYERRGGVVGEVEVQAGDSIHVDGKDQDGLRMAARFVSDLAIISAAFTLLSALL